MKKIIYLFTICVFMYGCSIVKNSEISDQITFEYIGISNLNFIEIKVPDLPKIAPSKLLSISTILLKSRTSTDNIIPFNFDVNLKANNYAKKEIRIDSIDYVLEVDNIIFSKGSYNGLIYISGEKSEKIGINVNIDFKDLVQKYSYKKVLQEINTLFGFKGEEPKIDFKIRPRFMINDHNIFSDEYISVVSK